MKKILSCPFHGHIFFFHLLLNCQPLFHFLPLSLDVIGVFKYQYSLSTCDNWSIDIDRSHIDWLKCSIKKIQCHQNSYKYKHVQNFHQQCWIWIDCPPLMYKICQFYAKKYKNLIKKKSLEFNTVHCSCFFSSFLSFSRKDRNSTVGVNDRKNI